MTITDEVKTDLAALVADLLADVAMTGWSDQTDEDGDPSLCLTVSTNDGSTWGYQTGDNSFTGGAYGGRHWAVTYLHPDSNPAAVVAEIVSQWEDLAAGSE